MHLVPIQVTEEGIFIPKVYLHDADEVEVVIEADYILVRPKQPDIPTVEGVKRHRYSFIGIGRTTNPKASVEAEDILARDIDRRDGWTAQP